MNRVVIQSGYSMPFAGVKRRKSSKRKTAKRAKRGGAKAQQNKMKSCAKSWFGRGSYRVHMKRCLKKK